MNFLKKLFSNDESYQSTNRLEELLISASENEAFRPDFYRQIFHFKLFVIGKMGDDGSLELLNNQIDGFEYSYAYTSLSALEFAIRKSKNELPYIEIDSLQFFEFLSSVKLGLILNANMDNGVLSGLVRHGVEGNLSQKNVSILA